MEPANHETIYKARIIADNAARVAQACAEAAGAIAYAGDFAGGAHESGEVQRTMREACAGMLRSLTSLAQACAKSAADAAATVAAATDGEPARMAGVDARAAASNFTRCDAMVRQCTYVWGL